MTWLLIGGALLVYIAGSYYLVYFIILSVLSLLCLVYLIYKFVRFANGLA